MNIHQFQRCNQKFSWCLEKKKLWEFLVQIKSLRYEKLDDFIHENNMCIKCI